MPLDQSDRIRRIQQTTIFTGWAIQQQTQQPGQNISTCVGFYSPSTIHKFATYEYDNQVTEGQKYFRACQTANSSNT